jgi:hemoglobin
MTIYSEVGGAPAVAAVVDLFYEKLSAEPALDRYFGGVDLTGLKAHQRAFVGAALGGPGAYEGRNMKDAHTGLHIDRPAFDLVVSHLKAALEELGVPPATVAVILGNLAPLADDIIQA